MSTKNYIEQHLAEGLVSDRIVDIMDEYFDADLAELYNRAGDGLTGPPDEAGAWTPGIYLPSPVEYYLQTADATTAAKGVGFVSCYIGPTSPATPTTPGTAARATSEGFVWQMEQSFAVALVFGISAGQVAVYDRRGRELRMEEIMDKRASYYAGALCHTIFRHAKGSNEIWGTRPGPRTSGIADLGTDESDYALIGVATYEFTVVNDQLFPPHAY